MSNAAVRILSVVCAICLFAAGPGRADLVFSIDAQPADSIDGRGDINLNGLENEIADVLLFQKALLEGPQVLPHPEASTIRTDINNDNIEMGLNDLVYLVRIVIGDASPEPDIEVATDTASVINYSASSTVVVSYPGSLGGALFVFDGEVSASTAIPGAAVAQHFDGHVTRVLVSHDPIIPVFGELPKFAPGQVLTYTGDGVLVGAAIADSAGVVNVPVNIVGGRDIGRGDFNLNNIPYEAGDFLEYRDYHLNGFRSNSSDTLRQIVASDINGDSRAQTLEDLLYLGKIVLGGTGPIPGQISLPDSSTSIFQGFIDANISISRPRPASAGSFYFDRHVDLEFRGDDFWFVIDSSLVGGKTVMTILPKLVAASDTLGTIPTTCLNTLSFGVLDSAIAAGDDFVHRSMRRFVPTLELTMINDTVLNLVTVQHADPMNGAQCIFEGTIQPRLLIDSFAFAAPSKNGVTVVSILPSGLIGNYSFTSGHLLSYSGRGVLARGEASNKYLMKSSYAEIIITASPLGDVSMDGSVDGVDLQWVIEYLFHDDDTVLGIHAADFDRDGDVSPIDLSRLVDLLYN